METGIRENRLSPRGGGRGEGGGRGRGGRGTYGTLFGPFGAERGVFFFSGPTFWGFFFFLRFFSPPVSGAGKPPWGGMEHNGGRGLEVRGAGFFAAVFDFFLGRGQGCFEFFFLSGPRGRGFLSACDERFDVPFGVVFGGSFVF